MLIRESAPGSGKPFISSNFKILTFVFLSNQIAVDVAMSVLSAPVFRLVYVTRTVLAAGLFV